MATHEASIRRVIDEGAFTTVFQPIFSLASGDVVSLEALTRITLTAPSSPASWLAEAHRVGLGTELELAVLRGALDTARTFPDHLSLSVNLSPTALIDPPTLSLLLARPVRNLVVELTEQPSLHVHPHLLRQRGQLASAGIGLAVGNVAARRASVGRLLALRPDQVKTELWLTAEIETDPARRILAGSLLRVARHQRAQLVAEGIETPGQLATWRRLGADAAQGYLLAEPAPLEEALRTTRVPVAGRGG